MRLLLAILLLLIAAPAWAQQGQGMSQAVVVSSCGGGALPSGVLNQLTMNPQGQLCLSGIAATGCSQATSYLARATGETTHATDLTTMICGLVTDGVWVKLDALYVLAQQTQADARLNLIGASYPLVNASAPTFTAYHGFTGDNGTGLVTGFNPVTSPSPQLTQTSGTAGIWIYSGIDSGLQLGTGNGFGDLSLSALVSTSFFGYIFPSGGGNNIPSPGTTGYFAVDRASSAAASTDYYWNSTHPGVSLGPASQAPNNAQVVVLQGSLTTLSETHFGASLGSAGNLALYNRLRAYLTAVGVP